MIRMLVEDMLSDLGHTITDGPSSVTVPDLAESSITITKSTTSTGFSAAGDVLPYSYLVTNTGATTLNGVSVTDNLIGTASCPNATLAPGASAASPRYS